jgi:hypothetical protein
MAGLLTAYAPAWGDNLVLANSSFENLPAGGLNSSSSMGAYEGGSVPGWTGRGWFGEWAPTLGTTLDSLPDGPTVAFVSNGEIWQDVGPVLAADTTYILSVDVGERTDVPANALVALWINGSQYIATQNPITPGGWSTYTVTYNSIKPDVGADLYIQLMDVTPTNGGYTEAVFDNVVMDPDPTVPEPGTAALFAVFLAGLGVYKWRTARRRLAASGPEYAGV